MSKSQPPASIATLPSEILAAIIERALPDDVPSTCDVENLVLAGWKPPSFLSSDKSRCRRAVHPYATLYVNKRFNAETARVLQSRQFRIIMDEKSFWGEYIQSDNNWLDELLNSMIARQNWNVAFPGLDLRKIKELVIEISPMNRPGFWHSANKAAMSLCEKQLLPRGPLRNLTIEVNDMSEGANIAEAWEWRRRSAAWGFAQCDDYLDVLEPFSEVAAQADQCEIRLPYWVERVAAKEKLIKWEPLGARVVFVPLPRSGWKWYGEASERELHGLAPLPKRYIASEEPIPNGQ